MNVQIKGLDVKEGDYEVKKIRYSCFIAGSSNLEPLLRGLGRDSFIICGVATDVCVLTTTVDGMMLGFRVFYVGDLTTTFNEERQRIALQAILSTTSSGHIVCRLRLPPVGFGHYLRQTRQHFA